MPKKVLGLDQGGNSLGWAYLTETTDTDVQINDLGVRIFPAGAENYGKDTEKNPNEARRLVRGLRRRLARRKLRRRKLQNWLLKNGFWPETDGQRTSFLTADPYELRVLGLSQKLEPTEFARVCYHLNQRRGYLSSRLNSEDDDNDKGAIYVGDDKKGTFGINDAKEAVETDGKTLGEYLYSIDPHVRRRRSRFNLQKWVVAEFNRIWDTQQQFYPEILIDEAKIEVRDKIIFYRRKLKSQKGKRGNCYLEPKKVRCLKSAPWAQECRMLQAVNNLEIFGPGREGNPKLTADERSRLIAKLAEKDKIKTGPDLIKAVGIKGMNEFYKSNLDAQPALHGLGTRASIAKVLGKGWQNEWTEDVIETIWHVLVSETDTEFIEQLLKRKLGDSIEPEKLKKLARVRLEAGMASNSAKAIKKMLPFLREGKIYSEAAELAGYNHSEQTKYGEKPQLGTPPTGIGNPVVQVALYELRRTVNSIIQHHGLPDVIRIELARDAKQTHEERKKALKKINENYHDNERIRIILKSEFNRENPNRYDIRRYKLWEECERTCLYTGRSISKEQLFKEGIIDIEHIFPYSKTQDDSWNNVTLCFREENSKKGNLTPYEAYYGTATYQGILERVSKLRNMPVGKKRRFETQSIPSQQDFAERQLNDTRYMSRIALEYLKQICPDVQATKGQLTADLRKLLGLSFEVYHDDDKVDRLIENPFIDNLELHPEELNTGKSRLDHRHHAVDAVVIALTTPARIQWLTRRRQQGQQHQKGHLMPYLRAKVKEMLARTIVSYRVVRKVDGRLHKDSYYSRLNDMHGNAVLTVDGYAIYRLRKDIRSLTKDMISDMISLSGFEKSGIDRVVLDAILDRLRQRGVDPSAKKFEIPKDAFAEPLLHPGTGKPIKKVRVLDKATNRIPLYGKDLNKYVEPDGNHHVVVFKLPNGKQKGVVVSLWDAVKRKRLNEPIVNRHDPEHNGDFLYSLSINELFLWGDTIDIEALDLSNKSNYAELRDAIYRVQYLAENIVALRHHSISKIAVKLSSGEQFIGHGRQLPSYSRISGYKLNIDPAGFLSIAYD